MPIGVSLSNHVVRQLIVLDEHAAILAAVSKVPPVVTPRSVDINFSSARRH
jgi:hypothetical protein